MNAWFGKHWGAPVCDDAHEATPVGAPCGFCDEPIAAGDDGVLVPALGGGDRIAFHYECNMRMIIGGLNHQRRDCTCCGGTLPPDPPELSKHQAARAAERYWNSRMREPEPGET